MNMAMNCSRIFPFVLLCFGTLILFQQAGAAVPGAEALSGLIADRFDGNDDGAIDKIEWETGISEGFDEIDYDGDGKLTGKELDQLSDPISRQLGSFAANIVAVIIKKVVLTLDKDGDGVVARSEYDEKSGTMMSKLDTNEDDRISLAELNDLPTKLLTD